MLICLYSLGGNALGNNGIPHPPSPILEIRQWQQLPLSLLDLNIPIVTPVAAHPGHWGQPNWHPPLPLPLQSLSIAHLQPPPPQWCHNGLSPPPQPPLYQPPCHDNHTTATPATVPPWSPPP
ncbi:hypothetical protein H4582DRAFT_2082935 [Lactarius indigo]|nr:hypothetical protein H4582DRAFT_2082935 [Lactarius indigo]